MIWLLILGPIGTSGEGALESNSLSACGGEVWISQYAFEQGDRMAYTCSVPFHGENCSLIKKNNSKEISLPTERKENNDLNNPQKIASQNKVDVSIQFAAL